MIRILRPSAEAFQAASRHAGSLALEVERDQSAVVAVLRGAQPEAIVASLVQVRENLIKASGDAAEIARGFANAVAQAEGIGGFSSAFVASVGPEGPVAAALAVPPARRTGPEIFSIFRSVGRQSNRSKQVQLVETEQELHDAYRLLAAGGSAIPLKENDLGRVRFTDGTTVALRAKSRSIGLTVDINAPEVKKLRKVHIDHDDK